MTLRENSWARIADAVNAVCIRKDLRMHWSSHGIVFSRSQSPSSIDMVSCTLHVSQALSLAATVWESGV